MVALVQAISEMGWGSPLSVHLSSNDLVSSWVAGLEEWKP